MAGLVKDFRDLDVFRGSRALAMELFEISKSFPAVERFALTDQVRRSSRSVCANIAEAWRRRRYVASFAAHLNNAEAEAAETQVWLGFAFECGYVSKEAKEKWVQEYDRVLGQLNRMIQDAESWCPKEAKGAEKAPGRRVAR